MFRPRGLASNDAKNAGNSNNMSVATILGYRDTWKGREEDSFSVLQYLETIHAEKNKKQEPVILVMSDKGFKVKDKGQMDEGEIAVRRVQSVLNKLTEKNFREVVNEILYPDILLKGVIEHVVGRIYEKALLEPVFAGLYAGLCHDMAVYEHKTKTDNGTLECNADGNPIHAVRGAVLERCQSFFEASLLEATATEEEMEHFRKRQIANIKFVGELYMNDVLGKGTISRVLGEMMASQQQVEINTEVIINLLHVAGQRYESESDKESLKLLWSFVEKSAANRALSNRIRFLALNVIEWHNQGFPEKANPDAESASEDPQQHPELRQGGVDSYGAGRQATTQSQRKQYVPLYRQPDKRGAPPASSSATAAAPSLMSRCEDAGPSQQQPLTSSSDAKKPTVLATPPASYTKDVEGRIVSAARDAYVDGLENNVDQVREFFASALPGEPQDICRAASVTAILKRAVVDAREDEQALFGAVLNSSMWDTASLCHGFAWCLTDLIANRLVEDIPRVYKRFISNLVANPALSLAPIATGVFVRTAGFLDAIFAEFENTEEWDTDYVDVWEKFLVQWMETRKAPASVADVLNGLCGYPLTELTKRVFPDYITALLNCGSGTNTDVQAWCTANDANVAAKEWVCAIKRLFP